MSKIQNNQRLTLNPLHGTEMGYYSSCSEESTTPRRRSASQATRGGRRNSQTSRVQGQSRAGVALGAIPQLTSNALSYVRSYLPGSGAEAGGQGSTTTTTSNRPQQATQRHTCERGSRTNAAPAQAWPAETESRSVFTERGLFSKAMSTLGLNAPNENTCEGCEAEQKAKEAARQPPPELIHRGYEMVYKPGDPNAPMDEEDEEMAEKLRKVIALSDFEPETSDGSPAVSSEEADSDDSDNYDDDDDENSVKKREARRQKKKEMKRDKGEGSFKKKGIRFSLIKNRELSPDTRKARRKGRREKKEIQAKMEEVRDMFQPTCGPSTFPRRDDDDEPVNEEEGGFL